MSELLKPENIEMIRKSHDNFQWFVRYYDDLKERYKGKFIAIDDEKVIAENSNQKELLEYLTREYRDIRSILIQYIKEKDYVLMV